MPVASTPAGQPTATLPSVLPSVPALQDVSSTPEQIQGGHGKATNPAETPIFICAMQDCNRLFPSRDRLMAHRKVVHESEDDSNILTWNAYAKSGKSRNSSTPPRTPRAVEAGWASAADMFTVCPLTMGNIDCCYEPSSDRRHLVYGATRRSLIEHLGLHPL
ncbi:unnamed protein product [Somion occarium]|uniref:C2H2-type domain-containing protein n=1 Tax=Somion occarium TaxID=3059160 RepID=A0ABP1CKH8_9APHY